MKIVWMTIQKLTSVIFLCAVDGVSNCVNPL